MYVYTIAQVIILSKILMYIPEELNINSRSSEIGICKDLCSILVIVVLMSVAKYGQL